MAKYVFYPEWGVTTTGYSTHTIEYLLQGFNEGRWRKLEDGRVVVPKLSWVYAKKDEYGDVGVYFSNEVGLDGEPRRLGVIVKEAPGCYGLSGNRDESDVSGWGSDTSGCGKDYEDARGNCGAADWRGD